jgi:hypothetical protein
MRFRCSAEDYLQPFPSLHPGTAIAYMVFEDSPGFELHVCPFSSFDIAIKRHQTLSSLLTLSCSYQGFLR